MDEETVLHWKKYPENKPVDGEEYIVARYVGFWIADKGIYNATKKTFLYALDKNAIMKNCLYFNKADKSAEEKS